MDEANGRAERVLRQSRALGNDVRELSGELGAAASAIGEKIDLAGAVQAHPFRAIALAAGVGYVLGGGLFSRTTGTLLRYGTRLLVLPLVTKQLDALAQGATSGGFGTTNRGH